MVRSAAFAVLAAFAAFAVSACATGAERAETAGPCRYDAATHTLHVNGSIDAALAECVAGHREQGVDVLRVDSKGGLVEPALDAAEVIAGWRPHVIVEGQCSSSCANYWLPVARRITVAPGAAVILHGSIDAGFVERLPEARRATSAQTARRQAAFARRHAVAPGWLMTRSAADYAGRGWGDHLTGAMTGNGPFFTRARFVLVEEAMMRSCLPGVEIDPFGGTLGQRMRTEALTRLVLARQGVFLSGDMRCV